MRSCLAAQDVEASQPLLGADEREKAKEVKTKTSANNSASSQRKKQVLATRSQNFAAAKVLIETRWLPADFFDQKEKQWRFNVNLLRYQLQTCLIPCTG